ncbi:MAG: beta-galactosidase [Deltaproteobacteria bacterium]|nr:beta-galactosidase [Deltaproteobacteria bacterium]
MRAIAVMAALLLLPSAARAAVGDNSVGVNIHVGYPSFIAAAADLGVAWVRVDGNWRDLNPSSGQYAFGGLDATVQRATTAGLKVFMTLGYTPPWVAHHGAQAICTTASPAPADWRGNCPPDTAAEWVAFVDAAVRHYRPLGVTHFGLWNEANLDGFWDGTLEEYVDLIATPGAAAVRAACQALGGDCRVLGPELAHVGDDVDSALETVLRRAGSAFDIVTHHSYNGFEELGTAFWDGDRFNEVLDGQRCVEPFWCGRRSIRMVLDAVGWTGEVWITETGLAYRDSSGNSSCDPAFPNSDNGSVDDDEERQARYVELVLAEQLARPWYTNTFFYEIQDCRPDQPSCDIDGFGLMRATAGEIETRRFPEDVCRKDAFHTLRQTLIDHPELTGRQPPKQCGDGVDNDGDGRIDLLDRGCRDAFDDNEADDPPRRRVDAYRTTGIAVDGNLDDFGSSGWLALAEESWSGQQPLAGAADLSLLAAARWSASGIYLGIEVQDDTHANQHPPADLWQGDSVQLAFDVGQSGGTGYDDVDDHEINFALVAGATSSFRFHGPAGASDGWQAAVVRDGAATRYEILLPPAVLPGIGLAAHSRIGFTFLVNEDDGSGREGWIELTPGIGGAKVPELFGELLLLDATSAGSDGGLQRDAQGFDAGAARDAATGDRPIALDAGAGDRAQAGDGAPGAGCGCAAGLAGPIGEPGLALLALLASLARRRR